MPSAESKRLLKNTALEGMLDSFPVYQRWTEDILPAMKERPEFWNLEMQTFDHFRRALALVLSRGFHDHSMEGPHLVPVVDLLNHHCQKACTCPSLEYSGDKFQFRMYAHRDIEAGEEVYNTYGDLSDAQLLRSYGFVHKDCFNPQNCVAIEIRYIVEAAKEVMSADSVVKSALYEGTDLKVSREQTMDEANELTDKKVVLLQAASHLPDDTENGVFNIDSDLKLSGELASVLQVLAMDEGQYWAFKSICEESKEDATVKVGVKRELTRQKDDTEDLPKKLRKQEPNTSVSKTASNSGSTLSSSTSNGGEKAPDKKISAPLLKLAQPWVKVDTTKEAETVNSDKSAANMTQETREKNDDSSAENQTSSASTGAFSINFSKVVKEEPHEEGNAADNVDNDDSDDEHDGGDENDWGTGARPYMILQRALEHKLEGYISDDELLKTEPETGSEEEVQKAMMHNMCKHVVLTEQKLLLSLIQSLDKVIEDIGDEE